MSARALLRLTLCLAAPLACRSAPPGPEPLPPGPEGGGPPGLLDLEVDARAGRLTLFLPDRPTAGVLGRYIYVAGLAQGLGSNPVGLDRGGWGPSRLVRFVRLGNRLLVEEENPRFRADSEDPAEREAAERSFATSVLWSAPIEQEGGRARVDLTGFVVRDARGVARALERAGQGSFELDAARSAIDPAACFVFPRNVELEALLTFTGERPGPEVRAVTPEPTAVTVRVHHSLVALPEEGYRPRVFDPRCGGFAVRFLDFAADLDAPLERAFVTRHRLVKAHPESAVSAPIEPIVYYVDRAAPEPIRTALLEGARWWERAFEEAGFAGAFRVELLPEGVHPLDARYHVIQWVHRATRGWSYGQTIVDPRTGEIVKGHVLLGSQRVRQDRLIFEALLGAERTGTGGPGDPEQLALARLRQLAAHEVGHTLGLAHNFAASTYGRASVMDYPAPLLRVGDAGNVRTDDAYAVGVGDWDVLAIRYLYTEFPPGADEAAELDRIVFEGIRRGLVYLTDADARPSDGADPRAALWDNGAEPEEELREVLAVRRVALARFGEGALRRGRPLAELRRLLPLVYLSHRYQLEATAKRVGGLEYAHARAADPDARAAPVPPAKQREALDALLACLRPELLDLPDALVERLPPPAPGTGTGAEALAGRAGPIFDPLAAAETAADLVLTALLEPGRCQRLVDQHRRAPLYPGLEEVLDALLAAAFPASPPETPRRAELARAVAAATIAALERLAADPRASEAVRWRVEDRLGRLARTLAENRLADEEERAFRRHLGERVAAFLARPLEPRGLPPGALAAPPGAPIGAGWGDCSLGAP